MTEIELRVPLGLGEILQDTVYKAGKYESVAFGLVSHAHLGGRDTLLLRHVIPLPESAYRNTHCHGAMWSGTAMAPVICQAVDENLGIIIFHAHQHEGLPQLSRDDSASAGQILPVFRQRVPARPHGSIVLSRTNAGGIVLMPGEEQPRTEITVRWYGVSILKWDARKTSGAGTVSPIFQRQALVVGRLGQDTLQHAKVVVVGLGGGGSHVVQQFAHMGVGDIIGIDPDRAERTNQHRLIGWDRLWAWNRRRKVDLMRYLVWRIGTGSRFRSIHAKVPDPLAIEALKEADVIIGCLDNLHARLDLQDLAWRFLIPYVDIGVSIRPIEDVQDNGPRVAIGGNVITLIPGGFCLWCCGFLSDEKLALELNGPNRGYFQGRAGEAQVVSFNGIVASQAANEVLQLLTGFAGTGIRKTDVAIDSDSEDQRGFKKLNGTSGTLQEWGSRRRATCTNCSGILAQGAVTWNAPVKEQPSTEEALSV
jgi:hypothetical protein